MTDVTLSEARADLGNIARAAAATHQPVTITEHGHPLALLVAPDTLLELHQAAAYERYLRQKADGTLVTHDLDEAYRVLGLTR